MSWQRRRQSRSARHCSIDETLESVRSVGHQGRGHRRHRHSYWQRAARIRDRRRRPECRRARGVRRHPRHALSGRVARDSAARMRSSPATASVHGRGSARRASLARSARSTMAAASKATRSCRPLGSAARRALHVGARCRPCAAARSTARSARSGEPTDSGRARGTSTRWSTRSSSCGGAASASSRWPTTTSIPSRSKICAWRLAAQGSVAARTAAGDSAPSGSR